MTTHSPNPSLPWAPPAPQPQRQPARPSYHEQQYQLFLQGLARQSRQPFPPSAPARSARRTKAGTKVLAGIGIGVVVLLGLGAIGASLGDPATAGGGAAGAAAAETRPTVARLGQAARDGQFEFTVRRLDCTRRAIGGADGERAQGVFCQVHVRVANIGDEPRTFSDVGQYGYDSKGRRFEADSAAAMYLDGSNSFLEDINPGSSVNGILVFDVPRGTRLARVELHDSASSGGVEARLSK